MLIFYFSKLLDQVLDQVYLINTMYSSTGTENAVYSSSGPEISKKISEKSDRKSLFFLTNVSPSNRGRGNRQETTGKNLGKPGENQGKTKKN